MFCKSERQRGVRARFSAGTQDNSRFSICLSSPSGLSLSVSTMKAEHSVISYMACWGENSLFLYLNCNFKICIFDYR